MLPHIPYCPLPGAYGVAQINVEATMKGLGDSKALDAAQELGRAKCLIYLCTCLQLPFPESPWCKYIVYLVGPGPRPNDPGRYSTPDMCIPIFPCVDHPTNRPSVRPSGPFPFSNCYHWTGLGMERRVRVAIRDYTEYNEGTVAQLPGLQHVDMEDVFSEDFARSAADMRAAEAAHRVVQQNVKGVGVMKTPKTEGTGSRRAAGSAADEKETDPALSASAPVQSGSLEKMDDIAGLEIYGLTWKADNDLLPVINVWLDLGAQFPEESDIPNPLEFVKEYDTLVRIVRAAKGPNVRVPVARHVAPGFSTPMPPPATTQKGPFSLWRKIGNWIRPMLCLQ